MPTRRVRGGFADRRVNCAGDPVAPRLVAIPALAFAWPGDVENAPDLTEEKSARLVPLARRYGMHLRTHGPRPRSTMPTTRTPSAPLLPKPMTSSGSGKGVPAIFGIHFQTVSIAQKLVDSYPVPGGYQPGSLRFTRQMEQGMGYVDGAIGSMVTELQSRGLTNSTELIISAKHGQSPIDPSLLQKIGDPISSLLGNAGVGVGHATEDDVALIYLRDPSQMAKASRGVAGGQERQEHRTHSANPEWRNARRPVWRSRPRPLDARHHRAAD
jgi:hypothetical protein